MKKDPALNKKLSEVEDRQNQWLGRRVEAHDAPALPTPPIEQALEASAPESELEQLTVGSPMGPSGQGGEDQKTQELLEHFQQTINRLEKNLNELKEAQKEALNKGRQGQAELFSVQEGSNYDIAELFSPVRMTAMAKEYGLKGGWSVDDRCTDPITGRTYDLRTKKDQNEVRRLIKRDRPLVLTVSPPARSFRSRTRVRLTPVSWPGQSR